MMPSWGTDYISYTTSETSNFDVYLTLSPMENLSTCFP